MAPYLEVLSTCWKLRPFDRFDSLIHYVKTHKRKRD